MIKLNTRLRSLITGSSSTDSTSQADSSTASSASRRTQLSDFSGADSSGRGGARAGESSRLGFNFFNLAQNLTDHAKKAVVASVVGFTLLLPPVVGQFMHPGIPHAASPVAEQTLEAHELPTAAALGQQIKDARAQIPQGTGAAREDAIRNVIHIYDNTQVGAAKLDQTDQAAHAKMADVRKTVSWDAKAGTAVDLYWFGIPAQNAAYHAGKADLGPLDAQTKNLHQALTTARSDAREEVSNLLIAESGSYAQLHKNYDGVKLRYETAEKLVAQAQDAHSALSSAASTIAMRNMTPQTITVHHSHTEGMGKDAHTVNDPDTQETNPTYTMYATMAISEKATAEEKVRQLNADVNSAKAILGVDANIKANLIGVLDFIGQPSFGWWSFDASDVSSTESEVSRLEGAMQGVANTLKPTLDDLQHQVDVQIDARWDKLMGTQVENWS